MPVRQPLFNKPERSTMSMEDWEEEDSGTEYAVVVNHEEQYSIWPVGRDIPAGWREAGKRGFKKECLEYVEEVWTDIRPLSEGEVLELT